MPIPPSNHQRREAPQLPELTVRTDRSLVRATARSTRHAQVTITAPSAPTRAERIPANLAIVLDRSGSMAGRKFVLARQAVEQALAQLRPDDAFALIVYDNEIDVLAESTAATSTARREALALLDAVQPRGSTNLSGGWMRGCEQVALTMQRMAEMGAERGGGVRAINRCLLLTDGLANDGITDRDELIEHASALRARGVQTSTFGVGEDFDERLLAGMADAGGGHFYFLATAAQIPELIASEVGEALEVVIPQAVLEVRLTPGMTAESLTRFRARTVAPAAAGDDRHVLRVELGDLVAEQDVAVVVALTFPRGALGETAEVEFGLLGDDGLPCAPAAALRWTYASNDANDRQPRDAMVDRAVATLYAARARSEAAEYNRSGDYNGARHVLTATAKRIRGYAGRDPMLVRLATELRDETERFAEAPMSAAMLKEVHFSAHLALASRDEFGKARKRER